MVVDAGSDARTIECPACGRKLRLAGTASAHPRPDAAGGGGATPPEAEAPDTAEGEGATASQAETTPREPCPYCLELILPGARKCPYCQEYIDTSARPKASAPAQPPPRTSSLAVVSLLLAVAAPFLCFLTTPPAFLAGIGGLVATRRERVGGRGMAVVGLLLSLLWTGLLVGLVVLLSQAGDGIPLDVGQPTDQYLF
jgi:hypothetical protein